MKRLSLLTTIAWLAGCSGSNTGVAPVNNSPTISFATTSLVVPKGLPTNLAVTVGDVDGDPLTVSWRMSGGQSLTPQNSEKTVMRWSPQSAVGRDTVWVTVSDGKNSSSIEEEIQRGTAVAGGTAMHRYLKAASPYIVTPPGSPPNLRVSEGQTTVIEPGVEIYIGAMETVIDVVGTLDALGTAADPILIRPNDRTLRCQKGRGWWEGIRAGSLGQFDGRVNLTYVDVSYGASNVRLREGSSAVIDQSVLKCGDDAGVLLEGAGSLLIQNSVISNNGKNGVEVSALSSLPQSAEIARCVIELNGNAGIFLDLRDDSPVAPETQITIHHNRIVFNSVDGISLHNSVFPLIENNEIHSNNASRASNIRLVSPFPGPAPVDTIWATNNYWGAPYSSVASIDATITDALDNRNIGARVIVDPWLVSSPAAVSQPTDNK